MIVDVEILMHLLYVSLMNTVYNTSKSEIEVLHVDFFFLLKVTAYELVLVAFEAFFFFLLFLESWEKTWSFILKGMLG